MHSDCSNDTPSLRSGYKSTGSISSIPDNVYPPKRLAKQHNILRKMRDTSNPIYFLHIGKTGGSSIDNMMKKYRRKKWVKKEYWGFNHFDWSYIEADHAKKKYHSKSRTSLAGSIDVSRTADVITFLRDPVSRSISQFYFGKTLRWAKKSNASFLDQTLESYLHDQNKTWLQPLNDGEGGVDFLAGIFHSGGWIMTDETETETKEYLRQNKTAACLVAAQRLQQTLWFGLLEDVDRSMQLLQISLGLHWTPVLPEKNTAKHLYPIPSDDIKLEIGKNIPKDIWLYEFAKRLFDARWNYLVEGEEYISPELPPLPDFG